MIPSFKKSKLADRGKKAEDAAHKFLAEWEVANPRREVNRLPDTKAAGRIIKAAPADFEFYSQDGFGLLEVKSTEHAYRLARDKVPQLARMRKRAKCGGICIVLVHHSLSKTWRCIDVEWMASKGPVPSWVLASFPEFPTPAEALQAYDGMWKL